MPSLLRDAVNAQPTPNTIAKRHINAILTVSALLRSFLLVRSLHTIPLTNPPINATTVNHGTYPPEGFIMHPSTSQRADAIPPYIGPNITAGRKVNIPPKLILRLSLPSMGNLSPAVVLSATAIAVNTAVRTLAIISSLVDLTFVFLIFVFCTKQHSFRNRISS